MESLWPLAIVAAVGLGLIALYAAGPRLFKGTVSVPRSFWCPFRQRAVSVVFSDAAWDGRRLDVQRCTAFSPPTAIACDKACLALAALPAPPPPPATRDDTADSVMAGPDMAAHIPQRSEHHGEAGVLLDTPTRSSHDEATRPPD